MTMTPEQRENCDKSEVAKITAAIIASLELTGTGFRVTRNSILQIGGLVMTNASNHFLYRNFIQAVNDVCYNYDAK
ncbi:MAG: hypothetical protein KAT90_14900 [Gammaproteobacteria bacterium]|nr:hypothetical protein [Gammaproteobacteria bacterium]